MNRRLAPLIVLGLLLAACGDTGTTGTAVDPPISGTIHVTGGIAGIDETWTLSAERTVTGPVGESGTITDADLADLREAIAAANFFELAGSYMPDDTCCDRFTYELTITEGTRTNMVTTVDSAEAPQTLFTLIDVFRNALRAATTLP